MGNFDSNPIAYMDTQLRYYLKVTEQELQSMEDEAWASLYARLADIRKEEAKQRPF